MAFYMNPVGLIWCLFAKSDRLLGNSMFGTAPIEIDVWLYAIPFCLVMLVLDELRKARLR